MAVVAGFDGVKTVRRGAQTGGIAGVFAQKVEKVTCLADSQGEVPLSRFQLKVGLNRVVEHV